MSRFPAGSLVAVTGANGYIGSHIVQQLLAKGYRVRAIVRDPTNPTKVAHLRALPHAAERLELAKGELSEEDYVRAFAGAAAVIHAASPYVYQADDADRDIVQPAIKGAHRGAITLYINASLRHAGRTVHNTRHRTCNVTSLEFVLADAPRTPRYRGGNARRAGQ